MRPQWNTAVLIFIALLFLMGPVEAQQFPKSVTIGTNPAGTVFYPVAGGLASVISGGALSGRDSALYRQ